MLFSELNRSIAALLPDTSYELARSEAEKDAVFRLRYAAYLREAAVAPNDDCKLRDRFDEQTNVFNVAVKLRGRLFGAMRICVWSQQFGSQTTPGLEVFREELAPYLHPDAVMIDPNRFVIDAEFTKNQKAYAFLLMRISFLACIKFNATFTIASSRREHSGFYRRSFGHRQITEPRFYPGLIKPLALLVNDFPINHQPTIDKYPFFAPQGDDLERIFDAIVADSLAATGATSR